MIRPGTWWPTMLCVLAAGACSGSSRPAEQTQERHDEDHANPKAEHGPHDNLLHVDQGMLRDLRVTTQPAESRPAGDVVTVLGELRVSEDAYAEVGSSIAARVSRVLAAPGDIVKVNQALVELDSAEIGRGRAAQLSTQARVELARKTVERRRPLAADQIVSQREMQTAEAELAQAEAEHRAANQSLAALGVTQGSGSRFTLSSPIAGTIIERNALRGRLIDAEHPLFVIGDLTRLWLVVHAFERDALRMHPSVNARVSFPALPGQSFSSTLTRIGSRVDPVSRTVDVRLEIDNAKSVLRPGMSASALVPVGDSNEAIVAVPIEALQRQASGWCVFLPQHDPGVFEIRPVGRGRDLGNEVEVLSGLHAGEPVVVEGAFLLKAEADKARSGSDEHHH